MPLCTIHWSSEILRKEIQTSVILPKGKGPFPTLYFLHGMDDDSTSIYRRTSLERYAQGKPLIIVMPDGLRSYYTNAEQGYAYFDFLTTELISFIDHAFHTKKARSGRAIGGLSMGGYGAFRAAFGRPDLFCSVHSHSGAFLRGTESRKDQHQAEFIRLFGKKPAGSDHDLLTLARRIKKTGPLPKIHIDCGTDDYLLSHNRQLHNTLTQLKIPHHYIEYPGAHTWDYWDTHIPESLEFQCRNLRLPR